MMNRAQTNDKLCICAVFVLALTVVGCQSQANDPNESPVHTVAVSTANFREVVLDSPIPVVVDAGTQSCRPCRELAPIVETLAAKYKDKAVVGKLDVDTNQILALKFDIREYPTLLFFNDGELVDRVSGLQSFDELSDRLNKMLSAQSSAKSD